MSGTENFYVVMFFSWSCFRLEFLQNGEIGSRSEWDGIFRLYNSRAMMDENKYLKLAEMIWAVAQRQNDLLKLTQLLIREMMDCAIRERQPSGGEVRDWSSRQHGIMHRMVEIAAAYENCNEILRPTKLDS